MDLILTFIILVLYFNGDKVYSIVGFIALITRYFAMGPMHDTLFFRHDIQYSAVLYIIIVTFYELQKGEKWVFAEPRVSYYLGLFCAYILITASYDVFANGTSILDVFKEVKTWFFLLSFYVFSKLTLRELYQIMRLICIITFLHVIIYYFQFFTGIIIVNTKIIEQYVGSYHSIRYGYPPYFVLLFVLILVSDIFQIKPFYKYLFLSLALGTTILSLTRSILVSVLLGIIIFQSFKSINFLKYSFLVLIGFLVLPLFSFESLFYERFSDGISDITEVFNNFDTLEKQGTFSYRILHLYERLIYISQEFITSIIGIGYIHEENFTLDPFEFGIYKEEYNGISQLGTADISWSGLFLRYGLLGVILYLFFSGYFLKIFHKFKRYPIAKVGFTYLVVSFVFLSFSSPRVAYGNFWPIVFLFFFILQKTQLLEKQIIQDA